MTKMLASSIYKIFSHSKRILLPLLILTACLVLVIERFISSGVSVLVDRDMSTLTVNLSSSGTQTKGSNTWSQTMDARLPCHEMATDEIMTKDLLELNNNCTPSLYLEFLEDGRIRKAENTKDVPGNASCPRDPVRSPFRLPSTGLVSTPGSGNTWSRHLIQQLTGIWTGSVYNDGGLKKNGFPGEGERENVIVVKTHFFGLKTIHHGIVKVLATRDRQNKQFLSFSTFGFHPMIDRFEKQIIVLRSPFDAFLAEYRRQKAGHVRTWNVTTDDGDWLKYMTSAVQRWPNFVRTILMHDEPQMIVMYEDLIYCLLRELLHIANFLKTPQLTKFSPCCAMVNVEGAHHRKHEKDPSITNFYTNEMRSKINDMLTNLTEHVSKDFPILSKRLLDFRR